jgi:signal transduction histidine kinase/CheY-like chemotaxis protein
MSGEDVRRFGPAGGASTLRHVRRWTSRVEGLSRPVRYLIAVASAAGGLLLRLSLEPVWGGQFPYITLFPAVMVSALVGGFGPGLLTTFLAALGAGYFWVPPLRYLWITDPGEWLGILFFVVVGVVISGLNEMWRRGTVALADSENRLAVTLASNARLLEREQEVRAEIEQVGRLKDDFLAVLSHELRTPLNAVMGYAQLLLSGTVPPDRTAHALQAIQRNAQAQARLVESLLDLSRVLAGKLELNPEVIELSSVVALAVDAVTPEALQKNISVHVSGTNSVRVFADGPRLQQVFWNLLSNAIKFTPARGEVTVDLASTGAEAVIRVSDNGRGIASSLLPFVFDRFKQGDGESSRSRAGLGLGLTLVREMVHAHKGTVTAQSAGDGFGSTFVVRLPLFLPRETALSTAMLQTNRDQRPHLHQSQPNVLIVDDERDARDMLALTLEARGARVRHASTAAEAFDSMVERHPDVLLADVGMSGEDGYSLIRRWRTREGTAAHARVTAIAVTAYATATDRDMALAAGFDWHIAKPVDADELVRVIAALHARDRDIGLIRISAPPVDPGEAREPLA